MSMQTNELNLRKIRNENGVGLKEIANEIGKSRSHVSRMENDIKNYRICDVEKYLGLIGYGVDFLEFIKECVDPKKSVETFTKKELEEAVEVERKNTTFYRNENLQLTAKNEKLEKELEEYKKIILCIVAEKYTKQVN